MRTDEELRISVDLLKILYSDEEVRAIAEAEDLVEIDRRSEINFAKRESFEKGEKCGEKRGEKRTIERIAINMLKQGMSFEDIIQITKIDEKLLKKLKNNIAVV